MARMIPIILEELYTGEGRGEKYGGLMSAVLSDPQFLRVPKGQEPQTWAELMPVKQTLLLAEQLMKEDDFDSVMAEIRSSSYYAEVKK